MRAGGLLVVATVAVVLGCAARRPVDERTTQGPTAEALWTWRMTSQLGREPNFEERKHFEDDLELRIARYLAAHPEDDNALGRSAFRFDRQVSVGMSREQVAILLGPPADDTVDPAAMARRARKFWPDIAPRARAAWTYPLGWTVYFGDEQRVVDITRFYAHGEEDGS